jgi:hypothetical protein
MITRSGERWKGSASGAGVLRAAPAAVTLAEVALAELVGAAEGAEPV